MDRYKKTSLKFDKNGGYGRNLRAAAITHDRSVARNARYSMQRCLEDEVEDSENQPKSKIATFGKQTLKAPSSRADMLHKWKEEKLMKQKIELQNKKPTFKIGLAPPKSIPVFTTFNKTNSNTSSMKDSRMISYNRTNTSKMMKETFPKPPLSGKTQALPSNSIKPSKSKEPQIQCSVLKHPATQFSNSKIKKESHILAPNKPKMGLQKPSFVPSKQVKNEEVQAPMKSRVVQNKEITTIKATSKLQPVSALSKPTESKIFKKPEQMQHKSIPKRNNGIPEPKTKQLQSSARTLKAPSKTTVLPKQTGISNKTEMKPKPESTDPKNKESNMIFKCGISHIESPKESRKSFAPKGFMFNSFSFLEDGPLAIYLELKDGGTRTSTPFKKEEVQEKKAEEGSNFTESSLAINPASKVPEIQITTNTSNHQTTYSPKIKLFEELSVSIAATSPDTVKEQKSGLLNDISDESRVNGSHAETCENSCADAIENNPEDKAIEETPESENPVANLPDGLSDIEESPVTSFVEASNPSEEQKENTPDVVFNIGQKVETFEQNGYNCNAEPDDMKHGVGMQSSITHQSVESLHEEKFVFEEKKAILKAGALNESVQQQNSSLLESDAGIISRRRSAARSSNISTRGNRRSEMPLLESISESIENSSLQESPPKPPKSRKSTLVPKDFTPRRSSRLACRSESDTTENLFYVRPSLCDSPSDTAGTSASCNNITYDFDKLHLESATEQPAVPLRRMSARKANKVSLLYTPPQKSRASTVRKSIKGDLMSFSPDV